MKASDFIKDRFGHRDPDLPAGRRALRSADRTFDNVVLVLLILMLMFGVYSLVDSKLVYMSADASNYEAYRPVEGDTASFAELQEINPEVFGWLTVIDTQIDYPICRGEDNEKYVNTTPKASMPWSEVCFWTIGTTSNSPISTT